MATNFKTFDNGGFGLTPRSSDPLNPVEGDIQLADGTVRTKGLWQYVNGMWKQAGSGSLGINYITEGDAESGLGSFATYADAAGALPVDGTGGTPTVTFTISSSSPLRGLNSFLLTKDASNRQGEGASRNFTIDTADKAKILQISADYTVSSGTYATGDLAVYVYDVTNNQIIQPAGFTIQSIGTNLPAKILATFQTANNSVSYRLMFHVASVSTSAYVIKFDNISVGPQIVQYGAPITDWQAYTPTFTGFGTVTVQSSYWRRVGDSVQIRTSFTPGTPTAVEARVSLPAGLTSTANLKTLEQVGSGSRNSANSAYLVFCEPSVSYLTFGKQDIGSGGVKQNGSVICSSGDLLSFTMATIPIQGWSSTVQMSNDTDTRVVSFVGYKNGATQAVSADVTDISVDTIKDSHGAWSGNSYIVKVPGDYIFSATQANDAAASAAFRVFVNGTLYRRLFNNDSAGNLASGSTIIPDLKVDDVISLRCASSITLSGQGVISISRISGPSAIAASEKIIASYYLSSDTLYDSTTNINYNGKIKDSHGCVTNGVFTAPRPDSFRVSISTLSVGNEVSMGVYVNNVLYRGMGFSSDARRSSATAIVHCLTNDTISIRPLASTTLDGDTSGVNNVFDVESI